MPETAMWSDVGTPIAPADGMHDAHDFSLPITVALPEELEEHATTTPFSRQQLPGVRVRPGRRPAPAPAPEVAPRVTPPTTLPSRPLSRALHAYELHQATTELLPQRAVSAPPRAHASPLSDEDEERALRRARALRKQAWARNMLRRFQFAPGE